MALVPWKKLIEADDLGRQELLEEKLDITKSEIYEVEGDHLSAGCLIFEKSLKKGLKKNQALAEITTHTLSALVEADWGNSRNAVRRTSKKIKKDYLSLKNNIENKVDQDFSNIHFLREDVFELVKNKKFLVNSINKNGWDINFSSKDLLRGTKLPHKFDGLSYFLFGVYYAIGNPGRENQFYLNTTKKRKDFMDEIVSKIILKNFNIISRVNSSRASKKSGFNSKRYTFMQHEFTITSKAHQKFVLDYLTFWENKKPHNHSNRIYKIPELLFNDSYSKILFKEKIKYFFNGIINSRGIIQSENKSKILTMTDKNISYLKNIEAISIMNGYYPTLKPKNGSYFLRFSKTMLKDLVQDKSSSLYQKNKKIFSGSRGIFVNPYHIHQLRNFYKTK